MELFGPPKEITTQNPEENANTQLSSEKKYMIIGVITLIFIIIGIITTQHIHASLSQNTSKLSYPSGTITPTGEVAGESTYLPGPPSDTAKDDSANPTPTSKESPTTPAETATPTPQSTDTDSPTNTPVPTDTPTPTINPTSTPTETQTPTPQPTNSPTPTTSE